MNGLSLCSGIGGLDLGLHLAVPSYQTVCYVEKETFCQDILLARMANGVLDRAPIWGDVKQFNARPWRGLIDLVHGGYPCQPFSVAGKRVGTDDPRHLWPDIARIVGECGPEWCFFENVAGHLTLGFDVVARSLEGLGYQVAAGLFTAAEVGAPHRRQRLYILARRREGHGLANTGRGGEYAGEPGWRGGAGGATVPVLGGSGATLVHPGRSEWWQGSTPGAIGDRATTGRAESAGRAPEPSADLGHADFSSEDARPASSGPRHPTGESGGGVWPPGPEERDRWAAVLAERSELAPAMAYTPQRSGSRRQGHGRDGAAEDGEGRAVKPWHADQGADDTTGRSEGSAQSLIRGMAHGIPHRVDRLKALGNAVVPDVAALAWRTLYGELVGQI